MTTDRHYEIGDGPLPASNWYVLADDTFLSGWGPATGKVNTVVALCDTEAQVVEVFDYACSRSDMKNVRIAADVELQAGVLYSVLTPETSPAWFRVSS